MSDRNLVTYEEPRNPTGPYWTLKIDRSAAGQPGLLLTIETNWFDGNPRGHNEMTIVVENGNELLAPVLEWLNRGD